MGSGKKEDETLRVVHDLCIARQHFWAWGLFWFHPGVFEHQCKTVAVELFDHCFSAGITIFGPQRCHALDCVWNRCLAGRMVQSIGRKHVGDGIRGTNLVLVDTFDSS